jgi:hypothetical protein
MVERTFKSRNCKLFFPMPPPAPEEMESIRRIDELGEEPGDSPIGDDRLTTALARLFPERSSRWWNGGNSGAYLPGSIGDIYAACAGTGLPLDDGPPNPDRLAFLVAIGVGFPVTIPSRAERALLFPTALSSRESLRQYRLYVEEEDDDTFDLTDLTVRGRNEELHTLLAGFAHPERTEHQFFLDSTVYCPVFEHMVTDMPFGRPTHIRIGLDDISRTCLLPLAGVLDQFTAIRESLARLTDDVGPQ